MLIEFLCEIIKDFLIVGMLFGKIECVCELGLEFMVEDGVCLEMLLIYIKVEDVVIIFGNLIDNVFEVILIVICMLLLVLLECRVIEVLISDFGNEIILEVDD